MSAETYVLARFSDIEKRIPAIQKLMAYEHIQWWNAVEGHINLIMKIKIPSSSLPDTIRKMDGLSELRCYDILKDGEREGWTLDSKYCYSYIFIECESAKSDLVRNSIQSLDGTIFASLVQGGCDIVTLIKGDTFSSINRIVNEKIYALDGVIRVKTDRIIDLKKI